MPTKKGNKNYNEKEAERRIFKINVIGDSNVGKSTLIQRIVTKRFVPDHPMSIGATVSIWRTSHKGRHIKVQLWELKNAEIRNVKSLATAFTKATSGALLVFDLTSMHALDKLDDWIEFIRRNNSEIPILLVGTKLDLEENCIIKDKHANDYLESRNLAGFYKISSKTGHRIDVLLEKMKKMLFNE